MNRTLLRHTFACALLAALPPVMAADAKPAPVPMPAAPARAPTPPSALTVALTAVGAELQTAVGGDKSEILVRLDRFDKFHFSAPTRDKLAKVFGDSTPATFERVPASGGARAYRFTLNPFAYVDPNGSSASWTTLLVEASIDKGGRGMHAQGQWPSLDIGNKDVRTTLRGFRFNTQERRGSGTLWLGSAHATISSASVEGVSLPFALKFSDIAIDSVVSEHAKLIDINYQYTADHLDVAGQRIDALHAATRLINLDVATLQAFSKHSGANDAELTPQQRVDQMKPLLQALARSAVKHGSALVFDDISARIRGHKVSLSGRLALPEASEHDLDSVTTVLAKLVGHIDVRVPVALVREIAGNLVPAPAKGEPARTPETTAQLAQAITDDLLGKLLNGGFAKLDDGVLVSHIELKNGVVLANGKPIDFAPKPQPQPSMPPIGQAPRTPPPARNFMPARALSGRCVPAARPADLAHDQLTLTTTTAFTVGADGHPRDVRLTHSSGWPDFDAAVLEATRRCEWLPALANGEPIDWPTSQRKVSRPADNGGAGAPAAPQQ